MLKIPARVAIALTDDGWILRNNIVWHKPNAMPESVTDRLSTRYEHLFLLAKNPRYKFNLDDIREPQKTRGRRHEGRSNGSRDGWPSGWSTTTRALHPFGANPGDVWSISTRPRKEAHFAMFPPDIPTRCITASTDPGDLVLYPFTGAGTTGAAALHLHRAFLGIELVTHYADLAAHNLRSAERAQADAAPTGSATTRKGAPHVR